MRFPYARPAAGRPHPRTAGGRRPSAAALVAAVAAALAAGGLAGCAAGGHGAGRGAGHQAAALRAARAAGDATPTPTPAATSTPPPVPSPYPAGVGARLGARIPADSDQVVVADGAGLDSPATTISFYRRTPAGWQADGTWRGHNALHGWTTKHVNDDLRSPIGVYSLTDAGGELANPGTSLPYDHTAQFATTGKGFLGEPLAGSFDYVIAVNYNRIVGTSPLDSRRPDGWEAGGFIWLHVDHGGPTHGCVSVPKAGMVALLRALKPAEHPVIVMGDSTDLAAT